MVRDSLISEIALHSQWERVWKLRDFEALQDVKSFGESCGGMGGGGGSERNNAIFVPYNSLVLKTLSSPFSTNLNITIDG